MSASVTFRENTLTQRLPARSFHRGRLIEELPKVLSSHLETMVRTVIVTIPCTERNELTQYRQQRRRVFQYEYRVVNG